MAKLILKVDASSLKESSCKRRLFRIVYQGYTFKRSTNVMDYGTAYHNFKENITISKNFSQSLFKAQTVWKEKVEEKHEVVDKKEYLNAEHLTKTCFAYLQKFGERRERDDFQTLVTDEKTLVELKFAIPYRSSPDIDVLLCGTIDDIGKFKNGVFAFGDEKTSGTWKPNEYFTTYELSTQLLFYRYCIGLMGTLRPESIYGEITKNRLGAFINGVFYKSKEETVFTRSKVFIFPQELVDEFEKLLRESVDELMTEVRANLADPEYVPIREGIINNSCESKYGKPCKFFHECAAPDDITRNLILKNHFKQKPYDPLSFGGGLKQNE